VSAVERVEVTTDSNSISPKAAQMPCPGGKRLVGGGARITAPAAANIALQASFPDNDNIYRATAKEMVATGVAWSVTVFAVCANAS
jgi:hypothetical protein